MQPTLTAASAVVLVLSLLAGFLTNAIQSGSLLGMKTVPTSWLPGLTIASTLLGGIVTYLSGHPSLDGATLFYAVAQGLTALLASAAPGLALHAHATLPAARYAKKIAVVAAAAALCVGCTQAQAQSADSVAVDLTGALCSVAADSPAGQPYTDVVCSIAAGVEQGIGVLVAGKTTATSLAASPSIKEVRLRVATAQAAPFLAAHAAPPAASGH
jgi:hypothetical protein